MATTINLIHNTPTLLDALNAALTRSDDLSDAMRGIAAVFESAAERAFEQEEDPATGTPWAELSEVTKAAREKEGDWPGKILQQSGGLAGSVSSDYGKDFAEISSNKAYATTMFFGAKKGAFGTNKRGNPVPWGDIEARPFFGVNGDDEDDIVDILRAAIAPR